MRQELRLAVRVLRKSSATTLFSILSIALGIGLTAGAFSAADAILLRPFPIEKPKEVFSASSRTDEGRFIPYGWPEVEDLARDVAGLAQTAAYTRRASMLVTEDEPEFALTHAATPNYFSLLGVRAALGQASLEPRDGRPAAILGHRLWRRRFGGSADIVGKTILLMRGAERKAFLVAGVMPAEFTGLVRGVTTDLWVSTDAWFDVLGARRERQDRSGQFEVVARLKPGVNPEQVAARLDAAIRGPGKRKPAPAGAAGTLLSARFAPDLKRNLVLGGGVLAILGLVLFVACANVAQLRLAQAEARRKELGVQIALGAGSWRVVRQLLVETGFVIAIGAGLGLGLARLLMAKTAEFLSASSPFIDFGLRLDERVLAFTLGAVVFSVLLAGLAPARNALKLNVAEILKSEQGVAGARTGWQKKTLVVGQFAVSVALFGLAVMFLQSLWNATAIRPGFDPRKQGIVMMVSTRTRVPIAAWCEQVSERLGGLPGVRGATFARRLPLSGSGGGAAVRVEMPGQAPLGVKFNNVGGNYFALMGTRIASGRGIDASDRQGGAPVVVVSQGLVRQVFSGRNPLGEWISVNGQNRQVVGVAEDAPSNDLHEDPEPFLYMPFAQAPSGDITLIVETAGEAGPLLRPVRQALKEFDPGVIVFLSGTLRQHMEHALSEDRMLAYLATGMGLFGVLLTAAGLFGVLLYGVNRRTRELGLRVALGARPLEIQRMVLAESARIAIWGVPIGLALLGAGAWYVRSALLGVTPLNPLAYLASAGSALAIALLAAWIPARRATRVDPMAALRTE